jgi:hypothetical protein
MKEPSRDYEPVSFSKLKSPPPSEKYSYKDRIIPRENQQRDTKAQVSKREVKPKRKVSRNLDPIPEKHSTYDESPYKKTSHKRNQPKYLSNEREPKLDSMISNPGQS